MILHFHASRSRSPRHGRRAAETPSCRQRRCAIRILAAFIGFTSASATAAAGELTVFTGPSTGVSTANGGFCAPPALGSPCAMGSATAAGNAEPLPGLGLGNPVHLGNGNKYQLDIDLPPNSTAPGLELIRHYNGLATQGGVLGRNWTLSYDTRLQRLGDGWQLRQGDGSVRPISAPLPQGPGYTWQWPNGRRLHFDAQGRLERISMNASTIVRIHRHAGPHPLSGQIHRVENAAGHALRFHYGEQDGQTVLAAVASPLGRFNYRYGAPDPASMHRTVRLAAVRRPDGMERLYHYEAPHQAGNPYALTGISIRPPDGPAQRLSTWKYDRHGRIIELRRHGQPLPTLRIDYLQTPRGMLPGLTRVRSSNGRQQDIRFQRIRGAYQLLQGSAPVCADSSGHIGCRPPFHPGGHEPGGTPAGTWVEYDMAGRLAALAGLQLQRGPHGALSGLTPQQSGWPGLSLQYRRKPSRLTWQSHHTGHTLLQADPSGRPASVHYANGDTLRLHYDAQNRPVLIEETAGAGVRSTAARLRWRGRRLLRIDHPAETEIRRHDAAGRVATRLVQRAAGSASPDARFRESFRYDRHGRLLRHELPEGGSLHYAWHGPGARSLLSSLQWEDSQGHFHPVITSTPGEPGYRYGNGLTLISSTLAGSHADTLRLTDGNETWWQQHRSYDQLGRVTYDHHEFPPFGHHDRQRYVHDPRSRLQGVLHQQPGTASRWWYAWHDDGGLAALNHDGRSRIPAIQRDVSGLPVATEKHTLRYGPGRRLETIASAGHGQPLAHYRHNAFGHRIIKHLAGTTTHYLYLNDRLVAEARSQSSHEAPIVSRRYLHAGAAPVGMIEYPTEGPPRLYAVHADLSAAPRIVTDADRQLRWLASYSPTGQARRVAGDLHFPLRLPGQYEDEETGWHDNLLRTYVAELGHYLEPDPLGPLPGTDTFGYAGQQPWRYADPYGLLLFAFDGTRYDADTQGNVQKLAQAYRDGAAHYHSGPGNSYFLDWDAVVAWRAGRILENQWQALLSTLEHQPQGVKVPIDIIGFSRGAALARHFGNRIAAHLHNGLFSVNDPMRGLVSACVDLRFLGLFDTVAQFGVGGSHNHQYDFGIAELWSWVSHAVALHEHRWTLPLTSADAGGAGNVVEAPFVGAHADIGGGLALRSPPSVQEHSAGNGPGSATNGAAAGERPALEAGTEPEASGLAIIALRWMHWQALAANVDFADLDVQDLAVNAPFLHDLRHPLWRTIQHGDRAVLNPSGTLRHSYQDADPRLGHDMRSRVEHFIDRPDDWRSQAGDQVGTVDMEGYSRWLEETLGWSLR